MAGLGKISLLISVFVAATTGMPAKMAEIKSGSNTAMLYLFNYGYMKGATNPQAGALVSMSDAIIDFQAFAGLNQTGVMDDETIETMNLPRCGNRDVVGHGSTTRRKKRYALQGSRWRVKGLTYKITKYPKDLDRKKVDREIAAAFKVWEDVSSLTFSEAATGKVNIEIRFEKGEHGDGDPFDGRGGTLAHAYFPIYGGDAHFDDDERWTIDSFSGTNLFQVAAHEFGHSLGLSHSDVRSSLMAPFYRGYQSSFSLDDDDKKAIEVLYGKKNTSPTPPPRTTERPRKGVTTTTERPGDNTNLCSSSKIDAVVTMSDEKTYVFKGSMYWQLTSSSVAPGYPRKISDDWGGLPGYLDAAFTWAVNGKTFFFKGSQYWRFSDMTLDSGYPKQISEGFSDIPNNIDAAFVWSGNGKIYFFKGSKYWRFEPEKNPPVKATYPKEISNWEGIPNHIDDALQYDNGYTYFFKNGQYWRFNDRAFRVDSADPPFPRPVGQWWFGCESGNYESHINNTRPDSGTSSHQDVSDSFDARGASWAFGPGTHMEQKSVGGSGVRNVDSEYVDMDKVHDDVDAPGTASRTALPAAVLTALLIPFATLRLFS